MYVNQVIKFLFLCNLVFHSCNGLVAKMFYVPMTPFAPCTINHLNSQASKYIKIDCNLETPTYWLQKMGVRECMQLFVGCSNTIDNAKTKIQDKYFTHLGCMYFSIVDT